MFSGVHRGTSFLMTHTQIATLSILFFPVDSAKLHCSVMALRTLSFLVLVVVGLADKAPVPAKKPVQPMGVNETQSTWNNFVYCKCGLSCAQQMGSWYIFNIGQSCACQICPDTNATANLRGSDVTNAPLDADQHEAKTNVHEGAKSLRSSLPGSEDTWDSAHVAGTNLLYCPSSRSNYLEFEFLNTYCTKTHTHTKHILTILRMPQTWVPSDNPLTCCVTGTTIGQPLFLTAYFFT